MVLRITGAVVGLIILLSIAATLFRIYTAPDRVRQRLETAKAVCEKSGGHWVSTNPREPLCERS